MASDAPAVHVLVAVDGEAEADAADAAARHLFGPAAAYTPVTVSGDAASAIVQAADDLRADVVAVGAKSRGWFRRLFDPSVSRSVLKSSPVPVLVVRDEATAPDAVSPLVLLATDGSAQAHHAAASAVALLAHRGVTFELVHVAADRPDPNAQASGFAGPLMTEEEADTEFDRAATEAEATAAAAVEALAPVEVRGTVLYGNAGWRLCEYAKERGAAAVVMSTTGTTGLLHVLLGSVSEHVVTHCEVPVLVVPAASGG